MNPPIALLKSLMTDFKRICYTVWQVCCHLYPKRRDFCVAVSRYTLFRLTLIYNTFPAFTMGKSDASVVEYVCPLMIHAF